MTVATLSPIISVFPGLQSPYHVIPGIRDFGQLWRVKKREISGIIQTIAIAMYIVIFFLALTGMLPLAIILYKRNAAKKLISSGARAKARIYEVRTIRKPPQDTVYFFFHAGADLRQYTGTLTSGIGAYKKGQTIDVFYLPGNPKKYTVQGAWKSNVLVGFGVAIALFVFFVVYKLFEMIQSGEI